MENEFSRLILNGFESLFICAVDLFIMISGYFLCKTKKRSLGKIFFLIVQCVIMNALIYLVKLLLQGGTFSLSGFVSSFALFPYFLVLYSITYILSPWVNIIIERLSLKQFRYLLVLLFLIFSVYGIIIDTLPVFAAWNWQQMSPIGLYGNGAGYTVVNFMLCYLFGAYVRKSREEPSANVPSLKIWILTAFCIVFCIGLWAYFIGYTQFNYNNPLVILAAVAFLQISLNLNFSSRLVNELSKGAFTCYLIHGFFLKYLSVEFHVKSAWYIMTLHIIVSAVLIYLASYLVYKLYSLCTDPLVRKLSKHIDRLYQPSFEQPESK